MIVRNEAATGSLHPDPAAVREQSLRRAAHEFETHLVSFLVKGMRRAYLGEEESEAGQWSDFAESALAGFLAGDGSPGSGLGLTRGVLDRVHELTLSPPASPTRSDPATAAPDPEVSSPFGARRDPIRHDHRFHRGIDLRARRGDPVAAAADGVVVGTGDSGGLGRHVVVAHPGGYQTVYAHLDQIAVTAGTRVAAGEGLGTAGATGRATGPHLHFEVRRDGQAVDPMAIVGRARPDWVWPVGSGGQGSLREDG